MPDALRAKQTDTSYRLAAENPFLLDQTHIERLFGKPACLEGYRPVQAGPLLRLDAEGGAKPDTTFIVEPKWIESESFRIRGWLYLPKTKSPFPLVVLTSGGGGDGRSIKSLSDFIAPVFAHCGIAAFVHDKRGTGESEGIFRDTTFEDYILDTGNSAMALSEDPRIDADRIGVMGGSEGGRIAVVAASRFPVFSFAISMMGPLVGPKEDRLFAQVNELKARGASDSLVAELTPVWQETIEAWASGDFGELTRNDERIRAARSRLPRNFLPPTYELVNGNADFDDLIPTWRSLGFEYDADLESLRKPLFAVYGGQDPIVPSEASAERIHRAATLSGNEEIVTAILPNCGHAPVDSETGQRIPFENLVLNWMAAGGWGGSGPPP